MNPDYVQVLYETQRLSLRFETEEGTEATVVNTVVDDRVIARRTASGGFDEFLDSVDDTIHSELVFMGGLNEEGDLAGHLGLKLTPAEFEEMTGITLQIQRNAEPDPDDEPWKSSLSSPELEDPTPREPRLFVPLGAIFRPAGDRKLGDSEAEVELEAKHLVDSILAGKGKTWQDRLIEESLSEFG